MANQKITELTELAQGAIADADEIAVVDADASATKRYGYDSLKTDLAAATQTLTNKTIDADGTGNSITNIENADIKAAAGIAVNKLAALTASEIVISDGSGFISSAAVATYPSLTELTYVKGVTSAIQTQLNTKGTLSNVVEDTTPQLGGSLDVNSQKIVSTSNGNIDIEPNGTGNVLLGNFTFDADQTVGAGQDNYVMTYDNGTGLVSLEAQAGGGDALTTNPLSQFAATTSSQLAGVISDETGSGALVFATSPTLVTPALGTPSSGNLGSCTAYPGDSSLTTVGTVTSGNVDAVVSASSTTTAGKVELATTAEIDTGTDTTRAMPVDQFVASKRNIRWLAFNLVEKGTDCAAATNIAGDFVSPIAGTILQSDTTPFYLYATNSTAGTTGNMVVDININGTSIMTTNKLSFDTTEKTTTTAATPPDLTTTSLAVGDIITIDIDSVHTTASKGLTVYMAIRES